MNDHQPTIRFAQRMNQLPPYLFGMINKSKMEKRRGGDDVIDLGMGNPIDPAPTAVSEKLSEVARDPKTHRYPAADGLRFVFRAITPPGRPRRFDARFFVADVAALADDPDDLTRAGTELSHLSWLELAEARALDLPFITEVVLAEVAALMQGADLPESVPFFDNSGAVSAFRRIA